MGIRDPEKTYSGSRVENAPDPGSGTLKMLEMKEVTWRREYHRRRGPYDRIPPPEPHRSPRWSSDNLHRRGNNHQKAKDKFKKLRKVWDHVGLYPKFGFGRIRIIRIQVRTSTGVAYPDPDPPDPHVFGPPGSESVSKRSGSGSGSFYHHAKIVRKTLVPTILWLFICEKLCQCTFKK